MKEMDHKQILDMMDDYLDGELSAEEAALFAKHLQDSPSCQAELNWRKSILEACAGLDDDIQVPEEAHRAWQEAIRAESSKSHTGSAARRWVAGIAACLAVWLGLTGYLRYTGGIESPAQKSAAVETVEYEEDFAAPEEREYEIYGDYDTGVNLSSMALFTDGAIDDAESAELFSDAAVNEVSEAAAAPESESAVRQPKVIRSAWRSIETTAYDADLARLDDLVAEYSAYFESRTESGRPLSENTESGRSLNGVIRVPTASLDNFLKSLVAVGTTVESSDNATDVSDQYFDAQTRLESLDMQLKRLQEMVKDAADTDDLLSINDRIQEVEYEIEYLRGTVQGLDFQVSYSRVKVDLTEISETQAAEKPGASLNERIVRSFQDSVEWMKGFFQDAAVVLAMIAPQLVIWIPAIIILYVIYRLIRWAVRKKR